MQIVADKLDPEANIIWGAQIDESLHNIIRTTIVVSGVKSKYNMASEDDEFADDDFEDTDFGETISSGAVNPQSDDPLDEFLDGIF